MKTPRQSLVFVNPTTRQVSQISRDEGGTYRSHAVSSGSLHEFFLALGSRKGFDTEKAYGAVAPVYQAVNLRAKTLASVDYQITKIEGDAVVYDSDPMAALRAGDYAETWKSLDARSSNHRTRHHLAYWQAQAAAPVRTHELPEELAFLDNLKILLRLSEAALCLTGKVRMHKEEAVRSRRVDNLRWYNPQWVYVRDIDVSFSEGIEQYWRRVPGRPETPIPAKNILAIDLPDPFVEIPVEGRSMPTPPGQVALNAADVLDAYTTFVAGYVRSGLVKNFYFTTEDPSGEGQVPDEDTLMSMKAKLFNWLKRRGRVKHAEDVVILTDLMKVHEVGEGLQALQAEGFTMEFWRQIASSFDIPFALMSESAANYATMQLNMYQFFMAAVFPDLDLIENAFNHQLLNEMGYRIAFQKRRVEAVQFAEVQKAQAVQLLTGGAAVLTPEEASDLFGLFPDRPRASSGMSDLDAERSLVGSNGIN